MYFQPTRPRSIVSSSVITARTPAGTVYGTITNNRTFTFANTSSSWAFCWVRSASPRTGKFYWETRNVGPSVTNFCAGIIAQSRWTATSGGYYPGNPLGASFGSYMAHYGTLGGAVTGYINNGVFQSNASSIWTAGEVMGIACDFTQGRIWFSRNGTWLSGNPNTDTSPSLTFATTGAFDPYFGFYTLGSGTRVQTCAFSTTELSYGIPVGFTVLP